LVEHGPNPLKFVLNDDKLVDINTLHPPLAIFGTSPLAGFEIISGHNVILRLQFAAIGTTVPQLLRFPKLGDTGFEVLELQQALAERGFTTKTDGHWDDDTTQAIGAFTQAEHHSPVSFLIERIWQALGLPLREGGVPGFPGPAGVFPDG
jgi:hypothetical protein